MLDTLRRRFENFLDFECSILVVGWPVDHVLKVHLPELVGVDISEKVLQAAKLGIRKSITGI